MCVCLFVCLCECVCVWRCVYVRMCIACFYSVVYWETYLTLKERNYMHIHTYTHTHTHIRTYVHTYIHTYIHTYTHTCTHAYIYITHIHMYIQIQKHTCVCSKPPSILKDKRWKPREMSSLDPEENPTPHSFTITLPLYWCA